MSSSSYTTKYDVFISFRGEDTRETFTVHLFNALANKTIRAYMDCLLQRGDEVWPALEKAIESSLISIVVFSEKYATLKWCLEELVKILQWREYHGQVVISVFYRTDPSDIRNQSGSFEKAFAKYERDFAESLVGIEEIRKIVKVNMKQHRVIGIWGMRGIGKTTIAKMLFAKSFPHYDHVCYAENAKEYTPQRLLSELLRERITTDATGFVNSMSSLSNKKVLIILDNVKDSDQPLLEAVCEGYKSPQSRNSEPSFYAKLLVEIRMPHSHVKKLWEEKQELNNLEGNDLSECKELEELPDLSEAKRLRWDCSHLFEFPDNIDSLSKLRELRLDGSNVTWLPATIKCLQELEILSLNNCKFLETLPELPSSIKEFSADNCISLVFVSALNTLATKMVRKDETHLLQ
ncbi:TMV resistance protein N-like [Arachis duranensis]|uniref:TMV resistance protein N-like n=2 Tax=Arachis duranensis TaxID=130453 RepID=A0A9C6TH43_ARADU|nr:TMV resistance protein N-like [Arachis duranensis]